jgi:hypothetical protein
MTPTPNTSRIIEPAPGPYHCEYHVDGCDEIIGIVSTRDKTVLASITFWGDGGEKTARIQATAFLLAAAPDLRDLVQQFLAIMERLPAEVLDRECYDLELRAKDLLAQLTVSAHV